MTTKRDVLPSGCNGDGDGELSAGAASEQIAFDDRDQLLKLGKKPVLKRNFGFWSILSLSATVLITWEGSLILFSQGLANGGPGGLLYTFLAIWAGNLSAFAALCEVVSMAPTAAGQYHWVYMLAPRPGRRLLSFVAGWVTAAGWQGSVASAVYLCGGLVQALVVLTAPSYRPAGWHGTLLSVAVTALCVVVSVFLNFLLPRIEIGILVLHIAAFFGILVTLAVMGEHGGAKSVFATFANGGMWPTQGLSVFVGMIGNAFAFVGADAAFHLAEEIHNPSIVVPRSIITGILINGTLGFAMMIGICFSVASLPEGDIKFIFPILDIFYAVTNSIAGSAAMGSVVVTMAICATIGLYVSTSRVLWSFARDHGVPFWRTVSKVSERGKVPVWAVSITAVITCLLTLINIGSDVALNDVLSLSVSCLYISYLLVLVFLLFRRVTGAIAEPSANGPEKISPDHLVWGPWRIAGLAGTVNNVIACLYLILILFFSFWPPSTPVQPATMNYSVLVTGSVIIFSLCYYFAWAKKAYTGPIIEV